MKSSLRLSVEQDLDDLEHDEKVRSGDLKDDTRFRQDWMPCPNPALCKFSRGECVNCGKRDAPRGETMRLVELSLAMDGGLPLQRGDLSMAQWLALGSIRRRFGKGLL
jgi:hypothetical protein